MSESNSSACRILTVSSSIAGAKILINRLKALSIQGESPNDNLNTKTSEENVIPWTIVNRYYIADVHFAVHVIHDISPMMFEKNPTPPAVIYVWVDGESYVKHVEELSRMMGGYEPEVSLAIRIPKCDETAGLVEDHNETNRENDTDIDTVLMSYGFEYIDATGEVPLRRTGEDELPSTDDIPHLPRVLDALSTIMWPSMKSGHKGSAGRGFDNKSRRACDSILEELLSHGHGTMPSLVSHKESEDEDDLVEQMQELLRSEEWKDKDSGDTSKFDENGVLEVSKGGFAENTIPWLTTDSGNADDDIFDSVLPSPLDMESTFPFGIKDHQVAEPTGKFSIGFEDDFTVFVSAPAVNHEEGETTSGAIGYHRQQDSFESPMPSVNPIRTLEPRVRVRYHNLGSVSDFGGSDFGDGESSYESLDDGDHDGDHDDDNLPTKGEIQKTSAQIFGKVSSVTKWVPTTEAEDLEGDDSEPPYDISQVMDTLQQFKTDISGMDNEEERRKAAAKVVLGLLYGLGV